MAIEFFTVERGDGSATENAQLTEQHDAVGSTYPVRLAGSIALQLTGTSTAITVRLERTTLDPNTESNWGPAGDDITGNLATGIQCKQYVEPTRGWWRVRVVSVADGHVDIVLSGEKA